MVCVFSKYFIIYIYIIICLTVIAIDAIKKTDAINANVISVTKNINQKSMTQIVIMININRKNVIVVNVPNKNPKNVIAVNAKKKNIFIYAHANNYWIARNKRIPVEKS
jgi:hypothetical protein